MVILSGGGFGPGRLFARLRSWLDARRRRQELRDLLQQAEQASADFRPQYRLKAARVAAKLGRDDEALSLFGEAIDGYLEAGRGRAAEVACRQVVDVYPETVRARRTLALLALARDDADEATALLRDYAEAAKRFGDDDLIRKSLRTMGLISQSEAVRGEAADELSALGDEDGAQMVRQSEGVASDELLGNGDGPWSRALHAALLGADELRRLRSGYEGAGQ